MAFVPGVSHAIGSPPPFSGESAPPPPAGTERVSRIVPEPGSLSGIKQPTLIFTRERVINAIPAQFTFGKLTPGSFVEVSQDEPAQVGDVLLITYRLALPFLQGWQTDYIVQKLQKDPRYEVRYIAHAPEERRVWVEVKLLQAASPVILVVLAVAALFVGAAIFVSTESIQKLTTVNVAGAKLNLFPILAIGALVIVGLYYAGKIPA